MADFGMCVRENCASFRDEVSDRTVFVDSIDNREFHVRVGTLEQSISLGTVVADCDKTLNLELARLLG